MARRYFCWWPFIPRIFFGHPFFGAPTALVIPVEFSRMHHACCKAVVVIFHVVFYFIPIGYYNGPPSVRFFTGNAHKSFNVTASIAQALLKFTICAWVQPALWEHHGVIWSFAQNQTFDLFRLHVINSIARFDIRGQSIR